MPDRYDIFLSYPSANREQAAALRAALEAQDLTVWFDVERIDDAMSIQRSIESGLARSRVLVAWYSEAYARSRPCQWELTAALIVSRAEALAVRRVLVVNPDEGVAHIAQTLVRDIELIATSAGEPMQDLARRLHVASTQSVGLMGDIRQLVRPPWHGRRSGLGSRRFVGRLGELWRTHNALTDGRFAIVSGLPSPTAATALASVRGTGGMGKSLLAEEYALRFGAFWPGGVFWLDALGVSDRPEEAASTLAQRRDIYHFEQLSLLAETFDIASEGASIRQLRARIGRYLQAQDKPFLWIVDDLPACSRDELEDWQSPSTLGATLITTRSRQHEALGTTVALGILQPADAYLLLCRERQPASAAEEAAAHMIVSRLGGMAMAVDQARAACAARGFEGFLARLDQDDQAALELSMHLAGELPNGHEQNIARTFLWSIDQLAPEGRALLTMAAQLSTAPITRELVILAKLVADGHVGHRAASAAELAAAEDWCDMAMLQLQASSLADPVASSTAEPGQASGASLTMHTLIARVARWPLVAKSLGIDSHAWRDATVLALSHFMRNSDDIRTHGSLVDAVQHARQLVETPTNAADGVLLGLVALHDQARGNHEPARAAFAQLLDLRTRLLGAEHPSTLISMNNLAAVLGAMGHLSDACAMHEKEFEICQRVRGTEHPDTLVSMGNLATALYAKGNFPAARALQERVLAHRRRTLGDEDPATRTSMNNLAATCRSMGEFPAARRLLEDALDMDLRLVGAEHPRALITMGNLASLKREMGELAAARALQDKVLETHRRVLGQEHPDTLVSMNNLASTQRAMHELPAARALQEEALEIRVRVSGREHPETLAIMGNLASTLGEMGERPACRDLQEEVLEISQRVLGTEHPDTLTWMNNLANTKHAMGEMPAARKLQEEVLDIRQRVLGAEHPSTVQALEALLKAVFESNGKAAMHTVARQFPKTMMKLTQQP